VWSAALFAFLTLFNELLISMFLASVRAQTLPVGIGTITAVGQFLVGVTTLTLSVEAVLRPGQ
jgi:putative spermidine/putrescine transport system permease protein